MRNGSVGLVNLSLPSGSSGMMGRISMRITSTCSTITQPTRLANSTATRLWRARVAGDDLRVVRARRRLVAPLLGEEAQLVKRRGRSWRSRIGLYDLLVHRGGRVRVL